MVEKDTSEEENEEAGETFEEYTLRLAEEVSATGHCPGQPTWMRSDTLVWETCDVGITRYYSSAARAALTKMTAYAPGTTPATCEEVLAGDFTQRREDLPALRIFVDGLMEAPALLQTSTADTHGVDEDVSGNSAWLCLETYEDVEGTEDAPGVARGSFEALLEDGRVLFGTFEEARCIYAEDASDPILCDGADNDGDGEIDEGAVDTDGDGLPDCGS